MTLAELLGKLAAPVPQRVFVEDVEGSAKLGGQVQHVAPAYDQMPPTVNFRSFGEYSFYVLKHGLTPWLPGSDLLCPKLIGPLKWANQPARSKGSQPDKRARWTVNSNITINSRSCPFLQVLGCCGGVWIAPILDWCPRGVKVGLTRLSPTAVLTRYAGKGFSGINIIDSSFGRE